MEGSEQLNGLGGGIPTDKCVNITINTHYAYAMVISKLYIILYIYILGYILLEAMQELPTLVFIYIKSFQFQSFTSQEKWWLEIFQDIPINFIIDHKVVIICRL